MSANAVSELKQEFDDRGFVILRGVIDPTVIAQTRAELASVVDEIAIGLRAMDHIDNLYENEPFETRLLKLFSFAPELSPSQLRRNLHRRGMFGLFFCPAVLDLVEQILGPEIRLYPNYTVRPKLPDDPKTLVLWHQDAAYTQLNSPVIGSQQMSANDLRMVNVWTGIVPARPQNGCMQFIPGTHKVGIVKHDSRQYYLEIAQSELAPRLKDVVDVITDPGDVVLFSNVLFHCGQPNRTQTVRWSCDWRYQDAAQPTLRVEKGHMARSKANPQSVVRDPRHWANLTFS
jgi:ectoine hydroxylase-related dioxygenase (phytanoyl-CoA dioxygenase family)